MFFRFLFGLQKGSMVWDSVPVLLFTSRKIKLKICRVKTNTEAGEAAASEKE